MKKLYFVFQDGCLGCLALKEMLRRTLPDFPEIELNVIDFDLERQEAKDLMGKERPPFLMMGTVAFPCSRGVTMKALRSFLESSNESSL